jgi:dipeptidyl aminopeptidase/acylaminoacyl peptidase
MRSWFAPAVALVVLLPATADARQSTQPVRSWPDASLQSPIELREGVGAPVAEDLARLRDIGGPSRGAISVSPNGQWVAFQLHEPDLRSNRIRLTWLAVRTGEPEDVRSLGDGGELILNPDMIFSPASRVTMRGTWAPDSEALYYLKKVGEEREVWRSWIGSGVQERVTRADAVVMGFRLSDDGRTLLYSSGRPSAEVAEELREEGLRGFLVDDRLSPGENTALPIRLICDGEVTFFSIARGCEPRIRALDLASGDERPATPEEWAALEAGSRGPSPDADVRASLSTDALVYGCAVRSGQAVCLHETSTTPMKVVVVDLTDGSMETLYDPNPEWGEVELTTVERLEWIDPAGNPRRGHLVYPRGFEEGVRYPLVITPYESSGFLRGDVGDEYPIHLFANAGMMVLDAERARLSVSAGLLETAAMDFAGLVAAVDLLDDRGIIDRDRIGMGGLSYASRLTNYAQINSDLLAAASVSILLTPEAEYYLGSRYVRELVAGETAYGGAPFSGSEYYDRLSLARNAHRMSVPTLVHVSDDEFTLSVPALAALQDAGKAVEMHVFPDEIHQKWQPVHRLNIYRRNVQWFKFWLLEREDPHPVDPGQYERWRGLRG